MNDEVVKKQSQTAIDLPWEEFEADMKSLAEKIRITEKLTGIKFKDIAGIPRGGYIVAVRLSHLLSIPLVEQSNSRSTIYCDDIVDSGKTLLRYKKQRLFFVAWILKENAEYKPDLHIRKYPEIVWVNFPWEKCS